MPLWRRALCICIGAPLGISGASLLSVAGSGPGMMPGLLLLALGGLLAFSGLSPRATRDY